MEDARNQAGNRTADLAAAPLQGRGELRDQPPPARGDPLPKHPRTPKGRPGISPEGALNGVEPVGRTADRYPFLIRFVSSVTWL
ncbi:hypothetical protein GCM10011578_026400 [Streptomyces fuscichromogenes]|uniref:Uncharacterized protein n=1 Tax=Streptomyces fuscichromogenes TaxID=1324013 RepID=A0A918CR57_9ACTN|nr:hypothetical protein GCM10011578_026400 [Streptomyces fuscichromogenes]